MEYKYDDIDVVKKIKYLNELDFKIGNNKEMREQLEDKLDEMLEFKNEWTLDSIHDLMNDIDLDATWYDLDNSFEVLDREDIDDLFEENIEDIKDTTTFLEDYPQYAERTLE